MINEVQSFPEDQPLWTPNMRRVAASRIDQLRSELSDATGLELADTTDLHRYSLEHPGDFWDVIWGELGVLGDRADGPAFLVPPAGQDMRAAKFFPAASLNFATNVLGGGDRPGASPVALVYRREDGVRRELTWTELRERVCSLAHFLSSVGVGAGDRVAAWMPNVPETVIAMLAAASLGATFTSTSPDFGVAGVLDRFGQVEPTVLVAADGYVYGNRRHARLDRLAQIVQGLPTLKAVLVHGELDSEPDVTWATTGTGDPVVLRWLDALDLGRSAAERGRSAGHDCTVHEQLFPVDQPLYVLYSSGTTGIPKAIIHRAGGVLLKHLVEHQLHCDIRPGDRVFYFTTCGWMMWNWLATVLASGATAVLYDGSPLHPTRDVMWDVVEQESVTLFGTSAKYLDACAKAGAVPTESHDLAALRTICSTGSPLAREGFEFVYDCVKADVHLASISGGTDLVGCFVIGDPTKPVFAGEIQGPALGMAVDIWDEEGRSLSDHPGERGELVCTQAFPSMPLGFWNDPDGSKLAGAYYERYDGVWAHGDFASWTPRGGVVIHGRSDATLNSAGVRIGTAEIYRVVEKLPQVAEALAIGQQWDNDTRIVLFVRMSPGSDLDDDLVKTIAVQLREHCSPRHVPAKVVAVVDLPRTRSGKLAELAVADVVHGREVRNKGALANPEVLDLYVDVPELRT
ncbi:MAG: acetoacetate--CoA ligase [Actinomycetes bacterium]